MRFSSLSTLTHSIYFLPMISMRPLPPSILIISPVFIVSVSFSTPTIEGFLSSLDMIAVCDRSDPFSDMTPFAGVRRNTQPGSVITVTSILSLTSFASSMLFMTSASPSAVPLEQGIPNRVSLSSFLLYSLLYHQPYCRQIILWRKRKCRQQDTGYVCLCRQC